jgi:hypothetical protein
MCQTNLLVSDTIDVLICANRNVYLSLQYKSKIQERATSCKLYCLCRISHCHDSPLHIAQYRNA